MLGLKVTLILNVQGRSKNLAKLPTGIEMSMLSQNHKLLSRVFFFIFYGRASKTEYTRSNETSYYHTHSELTLFPSFEPYK